MNFPTLEGWLLMIRLHKANSYAGSVEHRAEVVTLFGLTDVATNSRILYRASCDVPHAIDQQYSLVELLTLLVNGDSCRRQQLSDFVLGPSDHPVQQMTFGTLTCCDVCAKATGEKDVTAHFHALAALVNDAAGKPEGLLTAKQVVDAYRGDKRDVSD